MHNRYIGILPEVSSDYYTDAARGAKSNQYVVYNFGCNPEVDTTSGPEDIWSVGGVYPFITTAGVVSASSSDSNDTSLGTGARKIHISGLDSNYKEIEETIILDNTKSVMSTLTFFRVHRAYVSEAGTSEINAGDIDMTVGGTVIARIPAGLGQTQMAIYTIPANKTAYLCSWSGALVKKSTGAATIELWERKDGVRKMQGTIPLNIGGTTTHTHLQTVPKQIQEKTDVYIRCSYVSVNNLELFSNFTLILTDNE